MLVRFMLNRYEEELEINDFPQNVRWRITGREILSHLNEYCDVGISVRGIHIPPGKAKHQQKDPENSEERPLYLCLESTNERNIALAKKEIMRIIKEELMKLVSSSAISAGILPLFFQRQRMTFLNPCIKLICVRLETVILTLVQRNT